MKHTMKKLLCMALAIMLLVSAVPVFAAADSNLHVIVKKDGATIIDEDKAINENLTLESALAPFLPADANTCNITYMRNGGEAQGSEYVGTSTSIGATLETMSAPISVKLEDNSYSGNVWRKITGTVTLNEALLNEALIYVPNGKQISGWNVNGTAKANGASVNVDWNMSIICLLADKAPAVGIITAVYSVDGGAGVEKKISSNAETVASLMEKGGYSQSSYELTKAGLGGTGVSKGLNDTIVAGQKVYIKMATKTTPTTPSNPTNPTNPSTPSTSSWINFAIKVDSSNNVVYDNGKNLANGSDATINNLIKNLYASDWASKYDFDYAWSSNKQTKITDVNAKVYAGDTVTVMLKTKSSSSSSSSGINYGTNGRYVSVMCNGEVVFRKLVHNDAELEVAKSEAIAKIKTLGYRFKGWK